LNAQMAGIMSSTDTSSDSVELLVLSFCLVEVTMGNPLPIDNPPPVCPLMLGWMVKEPSTHPLTMPVPLALRMRGILLLAVERTILLLAVDGQK
jgi:hypothetical protein